MSRYPAVAAVVLATVSTLSFANSSAPAAAPPIVQSHEAPAKAASSAAKPEHAAKPAVAHAAKPEAAHVEKPKETASADKPASSHEAKPAEQVLPPSMRPLVPVQHPPPRLPGAAPALKAGHKARGHKGGLPAHAAVEKTSPGLTAVTALVARIAPRSGSGHEAAPRAVVLACNDAVQTASKLLGKGAQAQYLVQNKGNQLLLGRADVTYAVRQLRSALLVIAASADCKAVDTARRDYSDLPLAEQHLLLSINIEKDIPLREAQLINLDNQVEAAVLSYAGEIESGRLTVVGTYYDAGNRRSRLQVVNVNGEKDKAKIARMLQKKQLFNLANGMSVLPPKAPVESHPAAEGDEPASH